MVYCFNFIFQVNIAVSYSYILCYLNCVNYVQKRQGKGKRLVMNLAYGLPAADPFPITALLCPVLYLCMEVGTLAEEQGFAFSCQSRLLITSDAWWGNIQEAAGEMEKAKTE